jgi:hypothetical protein
VFGFWLSDKGKDDFVFAKEPGGKDPGPHAIRGYLPRQRVFAPKDAFKGTALHKWRKTSKNADR